MASCSVCTSAYTQSRRLPMVLTCGHTFCEVCIDRLTHNSAIRCPTCRQQVNRSNAKVNVAIREQASLDEMDAVVAQKVSPFKSAPDSTLSIMTYWTVHDSHGFLRCSQRIKELVKKAPGVKYYGFSMSGNVAVSKEGYASVASYLLHLRNVQDLWFEAMSTATMTNMEAHGPKEQVEQLEETLKDLLSSHWAYADGAFFVPTKYLDRAAPGRLALDETLTVLVYWSIRDYARFLAGVKDFQDLTKQEEKVRYYGFCLSGSKAICREGYDCAEGFLEHLKNVDQPLKAAIEVADITRVEVHGPATEVEKLRSPLSTFPAVFWSYPDDSFIVPAEYAAPVCQAPIPVATSTNSTVARVPAVAPSPAVTPAASALAQAGATVVAPSLRAGAPVMTIAPRISSPGSGPAPHAFFSFRGSRSPSDPSIRHSSRN